MIVTDQYNNEIKPEMVINYPTNSGELTMRTMLVKEIIILNQDFAPDYGDIIIKGLIEDYYLTIEDDNIWGKKYYIKKTVFRSPHRCTILNSEQIKNKYPLLYKEIKN